MIEKQLVHIERALTKWALWSLKQGNRLLYLFVILAIASLVYAVTHLKVNSDAKNLIDPTLPYRVAEDAYAKAFPDQEESLLIVVSAQTEAEADDFTEKLFESLSESPVIKSIFSPTIHPFFKKNGLLYQSDEELEKTLSNLTKAAPLLRDLGREPSFGLLLDRLAAAEEGLENVDIPADGLEQLYEKLNTIISESKAGQATALDWQRLFDGRYDQTDATVSDVDSVKRIITIVPQYDFSSLNPARFVFETVRDAVDQIKRDHEFSGDVGITGTQALRSEELQSVTKGISVALVTSLIMVALLLFTALRSFKMTGFAVLVLLISIGFSLSFAAAFLPPLNLVSVAFVVLLIGLGIDFVIHLAMDVLDRRAEGASEEEAIKGTIHDIGPALFLAMITTALAFLSFTPTAFQGMAQLGQISSISVIIAFSVTMTVVPAALPLLPVPNKKSENPLPEVRQKTQNLKPLRVGVYVLTLAAIPFASQMYFDSDPMSMRDPESPSVVTYLGLADDPDNYPLQT